MKVGDSVKIIKRVTNSYIIGKGISIAGFEGRIFDIHKSFGEMFVQIEFDSISLRAMSDSYIKKLIAEETDFGCIDLYLKEVTPSVPRDTPEDVIAARKEIAEKYDFVSIIDEGSFDIWEKQPGDEKDSSEIELEPEEKSDEIIVPVSLCKVREFKKMMSKIKREKMIKRKRTRKRKT